MNPKLIAAALLMAAMPFAAQAQKPTVPTKAQAEKVAASIKADKAKLKIYCDMNKVGEELDAADQKKDTKKVEALSKQLDDMSQKLGPDYVALVSGMQDMDQNSKAGQDIAATIAPLDQMCGK